MKSKKLKMTIDVKKAMGIYQHVSQDYMSCVIIHLLSNTMTNINDEFVHLLQMSKIDLLSIIIDTIIFMISMVRAPVCIVMLYINLFII